MSEALKILHVIDCEPVDGGSPVELIAGEFIAETFAISFAHSSLEANEDEFWGTGLQVRTLNDGIPRVIAMTIYGNAVGKSGLELEYRGRVEQAHLLTVANNIRHFEAVAAMEFMREWILIDGKTWKRRAKTNYIVDGKEVPASLTEEQLTKIRRTVAGFNGYTKRSPEFLREVLRVYNEAVKNKKRSNLEVQKHFESLHGRRYSITTVRGWIADARKIERNRRQISPEKGETIRSTKTSATPNKRGKK